MPNDQDDLRYMTQVLQLAKRGEGHVEPNPMVGCILVREGEIVGQGWHEKFGGPHAEINALALAGPRAHGATAYISLEPCRHHGKTPPCTQALIAAGVSEVVISTLDPFTEAGQGAKELQQAGLRCRVGVCEQRAKSLLAPYLKTLSTGRPWTIAKWAMTLDGKIADRTRESRWISSPESRAMVHQLRGRVDAVIVGAGTASQDDPQLTARPPGPRVATRVVLGPLAPTSQLATTATQVPVLVVLRTGEEIAARKKLLAQGVEILEVKGSGRVERLQETLNELGRRCMTNALIEGGAAVLGAALDSDLIDEVHAFIAPKLVGGEQSLSAIAGAGQSSLADAIQLTNCHMQEVGSDLHITGRIQRRRSFC